MLKYSLLGLFLITICVVIHAFGTTWWLRRIGHMFTSASAAKQAVRPIRVVISSIVVLTVLHIVQIYVWAFAFRNLLPSGVFETLEEALYFSFVTFTTLGYGDITLTNEWRILSGFEALTGVLLIGWSTAMSFAVVSKTWKDMLQHNESKQN